jgi:pimeloyl-ACP methyl ester carboxylesterase
LSLSIHKSTASWLEDREITARGLESAAVDTLVLTRHADADAPSVARFVDGLPANVEHEAILGQQDLMDVESAVAAIPFGTTVLISDWLGTRFPVARATVTPIVKSEARVGTSPDGVPIVERIGRFGPHRLFTIETVRAGADPSDELGVVVMQPAAAEHRVGPGRLQVHAARELAQRGYRAVRFDRRVTGDSTEVTQGEPSLVLAEEWVGDAQELVAALRGSGPLALVGLCSGAWVAARIAEASHARLTVLLDPNYFRTVPLAPGEYATRALQEQQGDPQPERLRGRLLRRLPGWLWRILSPAQVFEDPAVLLAPASRGQDSTVALLFTPEDEANFLRCRGEDAVSWLRDRGGDIRVTSYPFGDHALFGEEVRMAVLRDVLALVQEAIPGVPAAETSGLRA